MEKSIIELEKERLEWSLKTFPDATAESSLSKLKGEITECEKAINENDFEHLKEEYADCLMCLFDSAGRAGISLPEIFEAFSDKLEVNKKRTWKKNDDNSYSHIK